MAQRALDIDDTPVWRIFKDEDKGYVPVLYAWYTHHDEDRFLTDKTFGSSKEAEDWLQEFWRAYWRL